MGGPAGQDPELWRKLMSSFSSECHAGLPQHVVSKVFAEAWVHARLQSSRASVATRGLTEPAVGMVLRGGQTHGGWENVFGEGSLGLLCPSLSVC